jgi:glycosyltransferase involved in cell wall biosynthesis
LAERLDLSGKFVIGYIGTVGMAHALEIVPRAAAILQERGLGGEVAFLITGDGAERRKVRALADEIAPGVVTFVDPVPRDEVADYWVLCDAALVHLRADRLFETVIPSKIFEAMAMERPILLGVRGESARIVEKAGTGLAFSPENPEALADAVEALMRDPQRLKAMKAAGRRGAERYSRANLAREMERDLVALTHRGAPSPDCT